MNASITHVVFDLGGVIVKLRGGTPIPLEWLPDNVTPEAAWHSWLTSEGPKLFESGKIGQVEFSERVVREFNFSAKPSEFLQHYRVLPEAVYEGAKDLLARVGENYTTACFSNTNELHWERLMQEMDLASYLDHQFASHLIGKVKPDEDSYQHVINELAVTPSSIVFFDDNLINVEAARRSGMQAHHVIGVEALASAVSELELA